MEVLLMLEFQVITIILIMGNREVSIKEVQGEEAGRTEVTIIKVQGEEAGGTEVTIIEGEVPIIKEEVEVFIKEMEVPIKEVGAMETTSTISLGYFHNMTKEASLLKEGVVIKCQMCPEHRVP